MQWMIYIWNCTLSADPEKSFFHGLRSHLEQNDRLHEEQIM